MGRELIVRLPCKNNGYSYLEQSPLSQTKMRHFRAGISQGSTSFSMITSGAAASWGVSNRLAGLSRPLESACSSEGSTVPGEVRSMSPHREKDADH